MSIQTNIPPALASISEEKLRALIVDKSSELKDLVTFSPNKYHPTHRWYSFVEGFSSEFVRKIIASQDKVILRCYDPFGGVGTTALVCQELNIECISSEANPFIADIALAKLQSYSSGAFQEDIEKFKYFLLSRRGEVTYPNLETQTFFENGTLKKWIFHEEVAKGLLDIKAGIGELEYTDRVNLGLFNIAYASIIVMVSNVFRNGKCLSYRSNWQEIKYSRKDVHKLFLNHCELIILSDIISSNLKPRVSVENARLLMKGDSRKVVNKIEDNSIDLIITSPPYLNSRDYTDVYRLELWMLGYISTFEQEKNVRKAALTSHVQVALPDFAFPESSILEGYLREIGDKAPWNRNLFNMIKGYFLDIEQLLEKLYLKLSFGGNAYINVSNSTYFALECEVDLIIAEMAARLGYVVKEIQVARAIRSSSQQKIKKSMRESVIVLQKPY